MDAKQCVVVLDTNVLHHVRLYLSYAEGEHRYPHNGVQWSRTEEQISNTVEEEKLRNGLHCGGRVLYFMQRNEVELVRCSAVEAELFRLEAYSLALRTAMTRPRRVQGRWFSKFGDDEVNWWMTPESRQDVIGSLDETFATLDSLGIRVSELGPRSSSDVVWLARGIMTMVYMDAMDSVVYANALVAAATHLITCDGRFRNVVNGFRNPSRAKEACSQELSALVGVCTGMELAHQEFPVSQRIAKLCP